MIGLTVCECGATKGKRSTTCLACHNRQIAKLGYRAMRDKYGEKWAVRHLQRHLIANPSDLEKLVISALETLKKSSSRYWHYEREYWLQTRASGKKARVYLVDFMIGYKAIEVNGAYAHQFHSKRDRRKMSLLKRRGYEVLTLTDSDIKAASAAGRNEQAARLVNTLAAYLGIEYDHSRALELIENPEPEPPEPEAVYQTGFFDLIPY